MRIVQTMRYCAVLGLFWFAMLAPTVAAERPQRWSTASGESFEGRLADVYGSVVLVAGKNRNAFIPMNTLSDAQIERVSEFMAAQSGMKATWSSSAARVTAGLRGKLQTISEGKLVDFDAATRAEPSLYLIYFSAGWCAPCHRFTPLLVKAYERFEKRAPGKMEVIFVSSDRSSKDQSAYAREAGMPWPVLRYSALGSVRVIERWAGTGIPCLVAVSREGEVLFHSYKGDEYLGPDHVLTMCVQLLDTMTADNTASRRDLHRLAVIQHLKSVGSNDSAAKPYLMTMDPARYGEIQAGPFNVNLDIDERGRVSRARFEDGVPAALEELMTIDVTQWLFLPGIKAGNPCSQTVRVPIRIGTSKTSKS